MATTARPSPSVLSSRVSSAAPTAESASPAAMAVGGATDRAMAGVSATPAATASPMGANHSADSAGEYPSTVCRYWVTSRPVPAMATPASARVVNTRLRERWESRRRSSSGSSSRSCRRTKTTPHTVPTTSAAMGTTVVVVSATRRLRP